jgi:hypothetical protein
MVEHDLPELGLKKPAEHDECSRLYKSLKERVADIMFWLPWRRASATTFVSTTTAFGGSHAEASNAPTVVRRRSYFAGMSVARPSPDRVCAGWQIEADAIEELLHFLRVGDLRSLRAGSDRLGEDSARDVVGSSRGHGTRLRAPGGAVYTVEL